jgi:hypothetical protein
MKYTTLHPEDYVNHENLIFYIGVIEDSLHESDKAENATDVHGVPVEVDKGNVGACAKGLG